MMKDLALQVINKLPENATEQEIAEALFTILSISRGMKDFEEGKFKSQEELKKELKHGN